MDDEEFLFEQAPLDQAKEYVRFLTVNATSGNPDAQWRLGWIYNHSNIIERDYKEAFKWYAKAANQGHGPAVVGLAYLYASGNGVKMDKEKAKALIEIIRLGQTGFEDPNPPKKHDWDADLKDLMENKI